MTARQKKLYKSMSIQEQDMFDYLVHVQDRKPDDVLFFLHSTFQHSRDDLKKPSFANLSTKQVIATCKELERTAA